MYPRLYAYLMPLVGYDSFHAFQLTQDHEVFAKHNKFGIFLVPQSFLKWNGPSDQHHTLGTSALDLKKLSHGGSGQSGGGGTGEDEAGGKR